MYSITRSTLLMRLVLVCFCDVPDQTRKSSTSTQSIFESAPFGMEINLLP